MKLKENVLSSSIYYRFVLTATTDAQVSVQTFYDVKTNGIPLQGKSHYLFFFVVHFNMMILKVNTDVPRCDFGHGLGLQKIG